jgi:hypothetical protein
MWQGQWGQPLEPAGLGCLLAAKLDVILGSVYCGRSPQLRSSRLRIVLVDWHNLRLSLARAGRRAGPVWILRALVNELRAVVPDPGEDTETTLYLFMSPVAEQRVDRVLLKAAARGDPAVTVEVRCVDGDLLGIEFALQAADAWHGHPDAIVAVVTDAGRFAAVVEHFGSQPGRRPPWLLHLHERPPGKRAGQQRSRAESVVIRRLHLRLDRPPSDRDWTRWEGAARALQNLATHGDGALPRWPPYPRTGPSVEDRERGTDFHTGEGPNKLEAVDNLVADLWRLGWGTTFDYERAVAEAARRLAVDDAEADAAIEALLAAQLLRWHDADRLEIPSAWREGLLLPMRRVILRLARQADLSYPLVRLVQQHRRRFLGPMASGAVDPVIGRQVEYESRAESWRRVRYALLEHMGAVVEKPDWRSHGARWILDPESKFAAATVATAQLIRRRLAAPTAAGQLEAELERLEGLARPSRWLRCLRDVGLVSRHADRWAWERNGELYLR